MITNPFRIRTLLLAIAAVVCLPLAAEQRFRKAEPKSILVPTYLPCRYSGSVTTQAPLRVQLEVTNNTRTAVKKGTTIHWNGGGANHGTFILPNDLPPRESTKPTVTLKHLVADTVTPKAWYYK